MDVIFVDEAGQMALANVLALSPAATGIVLLGNRSRLLVTTERTRDDGRRPKSFLDRNPSSTPMRKNPTTRDDWKLRKMPKSHATIQVSRRLSAREIEKIKLGFRPDNMDEKWFIFYEEDRLYIQKSGRDTASMSCIS